MRSHSGLWFGPAEGGSISHLGGRELPGIMVATEPASGRVAMRVAKSDHFEVVLRLADLSMLAHAKVDGARNGAFCGPERLLLWNFGPERPSSSHGGSTARHSSATPRRISAGPTWSRPCCRH